MRNTMDAIEKDRGGRVEVAARAKDDMISVSYQDAAGGIDASAIESLFEPLRGSTKTHGLGIGLPIARALARAMGGDLSLQSGGAPGARFELTLRRSP